MKYFTKLANKSLKSFIKGKLGPHGVPHHVSKKLSKKKKIKNEKMFKGKIQENIKNKKKYFDKGIKKLRKQEEDWKNF
jgi:hypothetical protein